MIIRNWQELATTALREKVLDIIEAGINRVLPPEVMKTALGYDPARKILAVNGIPFHLDGGRIFVIGGGKAAGLMAETLEGILPPADITAGVVNCNCKRDEYRTGIIKVVPAGHPLPDGRGISGVRQMLSLKERYSIREKDIVICLISGGGSALMPFPVEGVSLEDKQQVTTLLLGCGASINEINVVRKHLSRVKGGGLGQYYAPATVLALIISDVVGNDLSVIASGQTCPDLSVFADARAVLDKYGLLERVPESVRDFLERGCRGEVTENPRVLHNCHNFIIGDNRLVLAAMEKKARETGFRPFIVTAEQQGDTATVARSRAAEILSARYAGYDMVMLGGETTPALPENHGKGGRNQHYAAVSMLEMRKYSGDWVVASVGTDGADFLPGTAGAMVDRCSLESASDKKLDIRSYLERYDSHTLLKKTGNSLVVTGNTGTNVGDIILYALK